MLEAIDSSIKNYTTYQYTSDWMQGAKSSMDASNHILYKIAAVASQVLIGIAAFCVETTVFIPGKAIYTYFYPTNTPPAKPRPDSSQSNNSIPTSCTPATTLQARPSPPGVMIPRPDLGTNGLTTSSPLPWSFARLKTAEGTIFRTNALNTDGSVSGQFTNDPELMQFQQKYRIRFPLEMSKEHPVTLDRLSKLAAGIPESATAFQFIYPGSLNFTFDNHADDTSENRAGIIQKITNELRPEMKNLLLIGGFYYHQGDWFTQDGNQTRYIAGINILSPEAHLSNANIKHLYFGQAKIVPQIIIDQLKVLAADTDTFYKQTSAEHLYYQNHPSMCPITVGPLRDKQLTHFKWLEPGHHMITTMQKESADRNFGEFGVFVYYSTTNPNLSCMLPVATPDQWTKLLRDTTYLQIDQSDESVQSFISGNCVICLNDDIPLLLLDPCHHQNVCNSCYDTMHKVKNICPLCRAKITSTSSPSALPSMTYKPHTELGSFALPLAELRDIPERLQFLTQTAAFKSLKQTIPKNLKKALNLPDSITHCEFVYPLYGKALDLTWSHLPTIKDAVGHEGKGPRILEGLAANGGFIFYEGSHQHSVYGILLQNSDVTPDKILHLTTKDATSAQTSEITAECKNAQDAKTTQYNACRITIQGLLAFAKYFQWNKDCFVYATGKNTWQAVITS